MAEVGLTQDQIDEMLAKGEGGGSVDPSAISSADLTALTDFERETMSNLPSVLNAMTGFEFALENVELSLVKADELTAVVGDDLIFGLPIEAGESMLHCLVLDNGFAKHVASALTGGEAGEEPGLSDMERSAIQEVVSQINGTYLTNVSTALSTTVTGDAVNVLDSDALAEQAGAGMVLSTITLRHGEDSPAQLRHLIPLPLVQQVLGKLQQAAAEPQPAAPAPEPQPEEAGAEAPAETAAAPEAPAPAPGEPAPSAPDAAPAAAAPAGAAQAPPPVSSGSILGPTTEYQPASFSQLGGSAALPEPRNLEILLDVPLQVTVELGKTVLPVRQILEYGQGSLITLDKLAGEPIDLLVNGKYFAKGEVVVIDENFGVRITSILTPAERIAQLT